MNTSSFVFFQLRAIFWLLSWGPECACWTTALYYFLKIFFKRPTVSKVLEKRESIVSVATLSFSKLYVMLSIWNWSGISKAIVSGWSDSSTIFVTENQLQPWINEVYMRLDNDLDAIALLQNFKGINIALHCTTLQKLSIQINAVLLNFLSIKES